MNRNHRYYHPLSLLSGFHSGFPTASRLQSQTPSSRRVGVYETDSAWIIQTDLPGFGRDDVSLSLDKDTIHLVAERENQVPSFPSRIERTFHVGEDVDEERVSASLQNGLLEITLHKPVEENGGPVEIEVN